MAFSGDGIVGQFTGFDLKLRPDVIDILRDHLRWLDVPILGGLPVGHVDAGCIGADAYCSGARGTDGRL